MDLSKLTPAEYWEPDLEYGTIEGVLQMIHHGNINTVTRTGEQFSRTDLEFIAMARKAFDVMIRRGWHPWGTGKSEWTVLDDFCFPLKGWSERFADPFTALVEADAWYKAAVEAATDAAGEEQP